MGSWWISQRIDTAVTRQFVVKHLGREDVDRLDRPVAYTSEDLTERTYWDSIRNDSKRIFLTLLDIGIPEQIFGIVDDGWEDSDLPLSPDDVERLKLTATKDDRIDRKFHQRQFQFTVRTVDPGEHLDFADSELVPLDVVDRGSPLPSKNNSLDKVKLPNVSNRVFKRRKYQLGPSASSPSTQEFFDVVHAIKNVRSEHMISYWASYTHRGFGYILLTPIREYNLKSFLSNAPSSFKSLSKQDRRELVMNWVLCLVHTMAFLHGTGRSHCYIKPSAIFFTSHNTIFFVDPTRLSSDAASPRAEKSSFDREWYDYAAPEQWFRSTGPGSPPTTKTVLASLSVSPDNTMFSSGGSYTSSGGANYAPPVPNPSQQADVFSLACIILELLSFLLKKSASKFASFRSAKLKKGGRGGAVLDTSFHKNLGQVEEWMSTLAKDAANKISEKGDRKSDGNSVFRGVTPMLHVVAEMLAANPFERPSASEVLRRMHSILTDHCGIQRLHCVPSAVSNVQHTMAHMSIQDPQPFVQPSYQVQSYDFAMERESPPPLLHRRATGSSGYSQASRNSLNSGSTTTESSEREVDAVFASSRSMTAPQPIRSPSGWARNQPYMTSPNNQASLYAGAP